MSSPAPFTPNSVYAVEEGPNRNVPRVLISPNRYVQGDGILDHLGRYLTIIPSKRAAVLISEGGQRRVGARLIDSFKSAGIDLVFVTFNGECSVEEVERTAHSLQAEANPIDCVVGVGGGKCVDAAKCVAYRIGTPAVIVPSLASNDAPCSALSVMYSPEGVSEGVEFFPASPALVAVDTRIVTEAPARYLVAGMGDAMATYYEARTCFANPKARSTVGARPTLAASAIGELCANTLFEYGVAGVDAVNHSEVNEALERVVEANTLLSGIGFESGGLACAHSVAQAQTVIPDMHKNYLHGEMVATGLLTQLVLESNPDEAQRVAKFFASVGLPAHFGQVSPELKDKANMRKVMESAKEAAIMDNEPFDVTVESLLDAASVVNEIGSKVIESDGDLAYRALH